MHMRYFALALAGCFLASCQTGPVIIPFKAGTLRAERLRDIDACKIASFKEIPQTIATQINPGYSSAPTIHCSNIGGVATCNTFGGINIPPSSYNYDVNEGLRDRYIERCLQGKGYSFIERPICPADHKFKDIPVTTPDSVKCVVRVDG